MILNKTVSCTISSLILTGRIWARCFLETEACFLYANCISYTEGEGSPCSLKNFPLPFSVFVTVAAFPTRLLLNSAISAQDTLALLLVEKPPQLSILFKSCALDSIEHPMNY